MMFIIIYYIADTSFVYWMFLTKNVYIYTIKKLITVLGIKSYRTDDNNPLIYKVQYIKTHHHLFSRQYIKKY